MARSKLPVRGPKKKAYVDPLPPSLPGTRCPNCGETLIPPRPAPHMGDAWEHTPHENPFDCIRYLRHETDEMRSTLSELRSDLANVVSDFEREIKYLQKDVDEARRVDHGGFGSA